MALEDTVRAAVKALEDKKAENVRTYDVCGLSGLCDAFVVATGTAAPHLKGMAAGVRDALKAQGASVFRESGDPESGWIVLDCVDVVVHMFSAEARAYYALEKIWSAAQPVKL